MTDKEFEQKAEEYVKKNVGSGKYKQVVFKLVKQAYIDGYKQGQKSAYDCYDNEVTDMSNDYSFRIKKLQKENEELKKAITEKNSEVEKLKAQIEKMKCCENCKHWIESFDESCVCANCENIELWEFAE